jgi:polyisoprenoid-binding protein YceI
VVSGRSAVLIEARSNVGPIAFGTTELQGHIDVVLENRSVDLEAAVVAALEVDLTTLTSGNALYDAELLRRIDARRHPVTSIDLRSVVRLGVSDRFEVAGDLSFHGLTQRITGSVSLRFDELGGMQVTGEHVFDIRDFGVAAPSVLMLRIYPDVRVELQLETARSP